MDKKKALKNTGIVMLNLAGMALVLVLVFVGLKIWMKHYTRHNENVEVPNVVGKMLSDANYVLSESGLRVVVLDSTYDKSKPVGCILEQHPAAGKFVKEEREIFLTINRADIPTLEMPDIANNSSFRQAEAKLKQMGFKLGPVEYIEGDKDWVFDVKCNGVSMRAGAKIPYDMPIVLVVGKGHQPDPDEEYLEEEGRGGFVRDYDDDYDDVIPVEDF